MVDVPTVDLRQLVPWSELHETDGAGGTGVFDEILFLGDVKKDALADLFGWCHRADYIPPMDLKMNGGNSFRRSPALS